TFVCERFAVVAGLEFIHKRQSDAPRHPGTLPIGKIPSPPQENFDDFHFVLGQFRNICRDGGWRLNAAESSIRNTVRKDIIECRSFAASFANDDGSRKNIADSLV